MQDGVHARAKTLNAPGFSMTLGVTHSADLPWGALTSQVTWSHQGPVTFDPETERLNQGTRGNLSSRVASGSTTAAPTLPSGAATCSTANT